ncbi:hypothetical protein LTR53_002764 [Teratosphaeriaceae sp. CCFEE 6253]|nr:hypothetical protein LTR53_002764 [Teratosphaeriaceae sp. CCFEE 6253]
MASTPDMQTQAARLATFQHAHQLSKRRASSTSSRKKKGDSTVEWPHEQPAMEELARAGFYYRPAPDSLDNVQCYLCAVKLDGWEASDAPLAEHLAHAPSCAWALSLSVQRADDATDAAESRDPMSEEMLAARIGTFTVGDGWVHEGKRGWRCKLSKMIEAGWAFDPSPEAEDGVTCFYCGLSLDGWEPKDDPSVEHKRRSPDCAFFDLCEQFHDAHDVVVMGGKKGKGRSRASTASKASRLSTQSAVSVAVSEAPSATEQGESDVAADASIMSNATTASQSTVKGGKRKAGGSAKHAKGRKRANTAEEAAPSKIEAQHAESDPVAPRKSELPGAFPDSSVLELPEEPPPAPPTRATRKGTRQASSAVHASSQPDAAPKKSTRGRKAKAEPEPEPEPEYEERLSDVSAQLQAELEQSMDYHIAPDNESTPHQMPAAPPKRGVKRVSDGTKKDHGSSVVMSMDFPEPPQQPAAKPARSRKPSKQSVAFQEVPNVEPEEEESGNWEVFSPEAEPAREVTPEPEQPAKTAKATKKAPVKKGKGKGKKASSARSSKATVTDVIDVYAHGFEPELEDLARDEAEIEAELVRMRAEHEEAELVAREQERDGEFEASPVPQVLDRHDGGPLERDNEAQGGHDADRAPFDAAADHETAMHNAPSPPGKQTATPSPNGSDKENQASSLARPMTALKAPAPILSPMKTTRIPLAPSTPNRRLASPSKTLLSPTKQPLHLTTTIPWQPVDLDTIFLASPQPTPGTLATRLVEVSGGLTSPEKKMSVEEWVRWRAEVGERELRRRGEEMVSLFEREGGRGVESLGGIITLA